MNNSLKSKLQKSQSGYIHCEIIYKGNKSRNVSISKPNPLSEDFSIKDYNNAHEVIFRANSFEKIIDYLKINHVFRINYIGDI